MNASNVLEWSESRQSVAAGLAVAYAALIFFVSAQSRPPSPAWPYSALVFHYIEYLGFGFVVFMAVRSRGVSGNAVALALAITVFYAVTDEVHQIFVPRRFFSVKDVLVDAAGSFSGIKVYVRLRSEK